MPYVNIKVTREGVSSAQKAELISGVTDLLVRVLDKSAATTFVVIEDVALCPSSYKMGHQSGLSSGGSGSLV